MLYVGRNGKRNQQKAHTQVYQEIHTQVSGSLNTQQNQKS